MAVVVVTRMRPRNPLVLLPFLLASLWATFAAEGSRGLVGGRIRGDLTGAFWTLTVWRSAREMQAYNRGRTHARIAGWLGRWASEAAFATYTAESRTLSWKQAGERLVAQPTLAPLPHANAAHLAGRIRPTRLGLELPVLPLRFSRPRSRVAPTG